MTRNTCMSYAARSQVCASIVSNFLRERLSMVLVVYTHHVKELKISNCQIEIRLLCRINYQLVIL